MSNVEKNGDTPLTTAVPSTEGDALLSRIDALRKASAEKKEKKVRELGIFEPLWEMAQELQKLAEDPMDDSPKCAYREFKKRNDFFEFWAHKAIKEKNRSGFLYEVLGQIKEALREMGLTKEWEHLKTPEPLDKPMPKKANGVQGHETFHKFRGGCPRN